MGDFMAKKGLLIILDGYGEGKPDKFNAVANAKTPFLDSLKNNIALLKSDGEAVGLFTGEMGGSEVGHLTIGSGRVVQSTAKLIRDEILDGKFKQNKVLLNIEKQLEQHAGDVHLIGLMSDKNIHSSIEHCYELMHDLSGKAQHIYLHMITDGRDCGSADSLKYLKTLRKHMLTTENCEIASIGGRWYAMDREGNIDRNTIGLNAMLDQNSGIKPDEIEAYLKSQHKAGNTDEYIVPTHVQTKQPFELKANDFVIFFNFREDRLRQIVKLMAQKPAKIATMADVATAKTAVFYPKTIVKNTLSEYLSSLGLKQIKISESTKYAHVTYFLNGEYEPPFKGEDRVHVPTIKIDKFNKTPFMQAGKIADETIEAVKDGYDAIIVNFSNPDMIGHTGDYDAVVKSLEYLDAKLKTVVDTAVKNGYFVIITADHGNSEQMRYPNGEPHYAHTLNKVMFAVVDSVPHKLKPQGGLRDVAPTFLQLLGVEPNKYFEGSSLVK